MPDNNVPAETPETLPSYVDLGRVLAPHALHGEVKVEPLTSQPERFAVGKTLWVGDTPHDVEAVRWQKSFVYLKLAGVDSIDDAEALRDRFLSVPETELGPLPEGEYYTYQLIGMAVYTVDGERLGGVADIFSTGGNDVYVVRGPRGEILLPAIRDVILEVDVAAGKMVVSLMDGMLPG